MRTVALAVLLGTSALLAGCVADGNEPPQIREIQMWVEETDWEVHPGITTPVWAFCAEGDGVEPVHDGPCGVPGPTIRVTEGDTVRLTFTNTHSIPHTVHFHGWHDYPADMHGNDIFNHGQIVDPWEELTIEWVAEPAGTFIYHCHFDTPLHMEMGMYGVFIVEERGRPAPVDHEFIAVLDEWSLGDEVTFSGHIPDYTHFTINGKSFPLTQPWVVDLGDRVRVHVVNAGYQFHAMHLHGHTPLSWEGVAGPENAVPTDVRMVAPGQSVVLEFSADREGIWLFHDHVVPSVTAGADGHGFGAYPRGMLTALVVGDHHLAMLQEAAPALLEAALQDGQATNTTQTHDDDAVIIGMRSNKYLPEEIEVSAGTTVTWVNRDPVWHTVTWTDDSVDSGEIPAGASWSYTFEEPGTYEYYCIPHAFQQSDGTWVGMIGTVTVTE
jgi:manganese oxidase